MGREQMVGDKLWYGEGFEGNNGEQVADWEQMGREQMVGDKLWYGEGFEGNNGEQVADWEQMGREQRGDKLWYGEGFEGNKWQTCAYVANMLRLCEPEDGQDIFVIFLIIHFGWHICKYNTCWQVEIL